MENKSGMYHKPPSNQAVSIDADNNNNADNPAAFSHSRQRGKIKVVDDSMGGSGSVTVSSNPHSVVHSQKHSLGNATIETDKSLYKGDKVEGMKNPLAWAWATYIIMWIISLVGIFFTLYDQFCDPNEDGSLCQNQETSAPTPEPTGSTASPTQSPTIAAISSLVSNIMN
eukprot:CAMPEP_0201565964 /NCGR_PEP_ID=MMETSP0190_2-20130828/5440_1 /ASSEMBLY_ACC=CAM_ASM_000263 /TAXON_ID=37353 /ORGANISM="Rosalina sp." /LENGTH=169 /DNA_ID=CAMNT_0047984083 /DNA_START=1203 /DNA_END=1712 /DNA_ORIENTATION=+